MRSEPESSTGRPKTVRRRRLTLARIAAVTAVLIACSLVATLAQARERSSPSYRYGQRVMFDQVYPHWKAGTVRGACLHALARPATASAGINLWTALAGCVEAETLLDS